MLSWTIFRRAVTLIVDDLGAALRITALPYAVFAGVSLWFAGSLDMSEIARIEAAVASGAAGASVPAGVAGGLMLTALVQLAAFLWIAVAWHRHVLLREGGEGWLPPLEGRRMLAYLGRSFLIGLIVLAAFVMVTTAVAPFAPVAALAIATILGMVLTYRLGLILPAGAIGQPLTMVEAWRATAGQSGTVIMLAVMTFALSLLLQVPAFLDAGAGPEEVAAGSGVAVAAGPGLVGTVYDLVVTWMLLMLGVTLLSTLYGHFVEGRPVE